jgi:hypothetical protein
MVLFLTSILMNNRVKLALAVAYVGSIAGVLLFNHHRETQLRGEQINVHRLKQTLETGLLLQELATQYKMSKTRFPSYSEFTNVVHFALRGTHESLSIPGKSRIVTRSDTNGGWLYDEQTGTLTINLGGEVRVSDRCTVNPPEVKFAPTISLILYGADAETVRNLVMPRHEMVVDTKINMAESLKLYFQQQR